ncbi:hypothetical protein EGH22_17665 [Halomicroarcula sp. F28]|uniref:DUF7573 domain-containing protein n=1 Tax=Haloarcula salinisoli TaxID=2487746 RepID=UPI001C729F34|nr:hypothetical protein [Halomicroarcula salinisoli]MBX0288161.1 hypothetical protein [Halomicroarcula salinisoli]
MGEDASLDEFLGGESSEQSEATDAVEPADETEVEPAGEGEPADADEPETDATDVEPARTTYAWNDEGATCEACGETIERRWQLEGGLVCIECKDWERA